MSLRTDKDSFNKYLEKFKGIRNSYRLSKNVKGILEKLNLVLANTSSSLEADKKKREADEIENYRREIQEAWDREDAAVKAAQQSHSSAAESLRKAEDEMGKIENICVLL